MDIEKLAQDVMMVCPDQSLDDIKIDLKKTYSVDATVNRIFDGTFLEGTVKDPSFRISQTSATAASGSFQLPNSVVDDSPFISGSPPVSRPRFSQSSSSDHSSTRLQNKKRTDRFSMGEPLFAPSEVNLTASEPKNRPQKIESGLSFLDDEDDFNFHQDNFNFDDDFGNDIGPSFSSDGLDNFGQNIEYKENETISRKNTSPERPKQKFNTSFSFSDSDTDMQPAYTFETTSKASASKVNTLKSTSSSRKENNSQDDNDVIDLVSSSEDEKVNVAPQKSSSAAAEDVVDLCGSSPIQSQRSTMSLFSQERREPSSQVSSLGLGSLSVAQRNSKKSTHSSLDIFDTIDNPLPSVMQDLLSSSIPDNNPSRFTIDKLISSPSCAPQPSVSSRNNATSSIPQTRPKVMKRASSPEYDSDYDAEVEAILNKKKVPKRKPKEVATTTNTSSFAKRKTQEEKEEAKRIKEQDKQLKKLEKEKEKLVKKQKVALEREKKKESQEEARKLKQCNKILDKYECMKEISVVFDTNFIVSHNGAVSMSEIQGLGGETCVKELPVKNSINWVRRVTRNWHQERRSWLPCPMYEQEEKFILVRYEGRELAEKVGRGEMVPFITNLNYRFPSYVIYLIIEGLEKFYRVQSREVNAAFASAVRGMQPPKKKADSVGGIATKEQVEQFLMWMQLEAKVHVQFSKDHTETAEWVGNLSKEIAMLPENKSRSPASFTSFDIKITSGKNHSDTWKRMLMQIRSVSADRADAIIAVYPTLSLLHEAYQNSAHPQLILSNVKVRNHAKTIERRIGERLSMKIHSALMGVDPDQIIHESY